MSTLCQSDQRGEKKSSVNTNADIFLTCCKDDDDDDDDDDDEDDAKILTWVENHVHVQGFRSVRN